MDQDTSEGVCFLAGLELTHADSLLRRSTGPGLKEMVMGAGGSALVHMLVAMVALLLPFLQPPREFPGDFVTVSLVEMGTMGNGPCDAGGSLDPGPGKPEGEFQPKESDLPKAPPPVAEKPVQPVERTATPAKTLKKPRTPAAAKQAAAPDAPLADQREAIPASAEEPASQRHGTDSGGEAAAASNPCGGEETGRNAGPARSGSGPGTGAHTGEFDSAAVDQIPQIVRKTEPDYPPRARRQCVCGRVVLRFLVQTDGRVSRASIVEASPAGYFEQSALDAVRHWHFKPGVYRGKAVATWVTLPIQFKLTG
ncbi:MAG TPA: energy transducer TonB [Syntrophobacteraceae bacterium]|nr:energy transducer TonB [Syntrophobacteraceae bacterium]